ncbi:adenylate/guanylate cyclase domain-containing protein [Mycolicibacterium chubuense]|uniref:Adenylate cyclase 2 n=1 Tax=Mycolicibacterium chubuense TaxID=1800 RepID=A0A0J6WP03_MYCCU|nr:adenylate/guanylate cyclase domain-containing protein [Mycolicibacterium chubuense]KMO83833.1 Adenylate cyclase 2 [Mycolicibacterium chubuense]ORA48619.1 adenylate/guanylate cyclase domain-containing protein [Mycolicibacterium chubuense]SPX98093.1 family 3 adenylate cyclase [Mycolicibacterium chubuense]
MDRIWQWAWKYCATRYSWVVYAVACGIGVAVFLLSAFAIVAFEESDRYVAAAVIVAIAVPVMTFVNILPGLGAIRVVERWAAGQEVDRRSALTATYSWARQTVTRTVVATGLAMAATAIAVGTSAGAGASRLAQWAILGVAVGAGAQLVGARSFLEGAMRPVRIDIVGDSEIGDSLPRSRPSFAAWSNMALLAAVFGNAISGAILGAVILRAAPEPALAVLVGAGMTVGFAVPITVGAASSQSFLPIRDLARGTERVAAGDYSQRLPVVQDDDLGALAASFNRMQAGLAERQRLHAAFGNYVDPALSARLLEQGDDAFTGERREVSVMFLDIRDFTAFAEVNTAEDTVARLNALFEIVVPAVVDAGGHINKFLGDGTMAVFGAPNEIADHADAAVSAALVIQRLVADRFGSGMRIGIGINSGVVIAGTIGAGGHLEFAVIGDTTNVASRVEQLTKTTGDGILLTQQCVDAMATRPSGLTDRGFHVLKGKSAPLQVFALESDQVGVRRRST